MAILSPLAPTVHAAKARRLGVFEILDVLTDGSILTGDGTPFPHEAYGRFKYCDGVATADFAYLMAVRLIEEFGDRLCESYIASSGIKHVPSAAHHLTQLTVAELSLKGYAPKGLFRIDRGVVKAVDYATLTHEERARSNAGRQVTLPEVSRREIHRHGVIVIDDIRISGSTEMETRRTLAEAGIEDVWYAYLVLLDEQTGARDASVESRLNQTSVKTLRDLELIVHRPGFMLNARTCKFILRAPVEEIRQFAGSIPYATVRHIVASMVADGYHQMPEYAEAFEAFRTSIPSPTISYEE